MFVTTTSRVRRRVALTVAIIAAISLAVPTALGAAGGTTDGGYLPDECFGVPATIIGTVGNDVLYGTSGPDVISGGPGHDAIDGRGGDDIICAGSGDDLVTGGSGDDRVNGDGGNDVVGGSWGNDKIHGSAGMDRLLGDGGDDALFGGDDSDICKQDAADTFFDCELISPTMDVNPAPPTTTQPPTTTAQAPPPPTTTAPPPPTTTAPPPPTTTAPPPTTTAPPPTTTAPPPPTTTAPPPTTTTVASGPPTAPTPYQVSRLHGYLFGDGNDLGGDEFFFRSSSNAIANHFRSVASSVGTILNEGNGGGFTTFRVRVPGWGGTLTSVPSFVERPKAFAASVIEGEGSRSGKVLDDPNPGRIDAFAALLDGVGVATTRDGGNLYAVEADWPKMADWPFVACNRVPGGVASC